MMEELSENAAIRQMPMLMDTSRMLMVLFTRTTEFNVLFRSARVTDTGGFVGALFAVFFFALFATFCIEIVKLVEINARHGNKKIVLAAAASAHAFSLLLHYVAMLLVMTMSVWIILAVVVGHGFGWALFAMLEKRIPFVRSLKFKNEFLLDEDGAKVAQGGAEVKPGCPC